MRLPKKLIWACVLSLAGAGVLAASMAPAFAQSQPVKIRIGWAQAPGHVPPLLYQGPSKALLLHYDTSNIVEPARFTAAQPQITGVAAGELQNRAFGATTLVC